MHFKLIRTYFPHLEPLQIVQFKGIRRCTGFIRVSPLCPLTFTTLTTPSRPGYTWVIRPMSQRYRGKFLSITNTSSLTSKLRLSWVHFCLGPRVGRISRNHLLQMCLRVVCTKRHRLRWSGWCWSTTIGRLLPSSLPWRKEAGVKTLKSFGSLVW